MSQPTWIGHTLGGRYEIIELLGQGGMSAVYKANDPNLRRVVAIKLIHSHLSDNPEFVHRFEEEAAAVASLRHPNIIQVYDFNHDGPTFYIVFEFIPGESLQAHLKRLNETKRLLTYEQTAAIATSVSDALSYAHNRDMVHRDVKPANVMLNVHGQAILMDFGVVKIVGGDTHTATGAVLGTATYMSPEQVRSDKVDARSDIYSLGVMLYEMASARPPFQADSAMTMMMMHVNDPVPDLWTIRPDVPGDLAEVIYKCLAKDPADRFQTASELVTKLREAKLVPPADKSTVIIPPAGAAFAGQSTAETIVEATPEAQTSATTTTRLNRSKVAIFGGIAGVILVLLLCIVAGVIAISNDLFFADGDQRTQESGTAIIAIVETEESENTGMVVAKESPTLTPTDMLEIEQASPEVTETETPTLTPTIAATEESVSTIQPTLAVLPYEDVEINILTVSGNRANTLQERGSSFEALTGAKVTVFDAPQGQLYKEILTDLETGTNNYDSWVIPIEWLHDFIVAGYVEELTDDVATDTAIEWGDIAPIYRDFASTYADRIFLIPLRGGLILGYYRSDSLEEAGLEPPKTWDDYLEVAATLHGQDLNDDGEPDYGSCIPRAFNNAIYAIASSMLQSQGMSQGIFFDTETMEPLVDNEALIKAMEIYDAARQYGPPDDVPPNGDDIDLFTSGRCALTIFNGDLTVRAIDPEKSVVMDKFGTMILPGSTQVIDRDTGILVDCDEETCPYAIDGINYAPFTGNIGWSGGINAAVDDLRKAAVYDFLSYLSQPAQSIEDVTSYSSGFTPHRISHITDQEPWTDVGLSQQVAASYLNATQESLNHPNIVLGMLIPQSRRYKSSIFNPAFISYQRGEINEDEVIRQIYSGWEKFTTDLGREEQLAAYRASLGLE